jgi:alanine dehydrogenase
MHVEPGERRDFTPALFKRLKGSVSMPVYLEHGYGGKLGFAENDYLSVDNNICFADYETVMHADLVTIIRTPKQEDLALMKPGNVLFSMLHYPTHRIRNERLNELEIKGISMDSVTDDSGRRYIEDFAGTARSALRGAFDFWWENAGNQQKSEILVTILGTGGLGRVAADEAVRYAGADLPGGIPVVVRMAGRNTTGNSRLMQRLLSDTDILVDTTLRYDTASIIVPNDWLSHLPDTSVIVDITADDYDTTLNPIQVKAIEGLPTGNLDQTLFLPDDPAWDRIPSGVSSIHRRPVISCYSWPGVDPSGCVMRYETQILPFLDHLIHHFNQPFDIHSPNPFARAIARGTLEYFIHQEKENQH